MSASRSLLVLLGLFLAVAPLAPAQGAIPRGTELHATRGAQAPAASPCAWTDEQLGYMSDLNTHVWLLSVRADPTISLTVQGTYPAARFASLAAYSNTIASLGGLIDKQFPPDPGSVNPFAAGTTRGIGSYTLGVSFSAAPPQPQPGVIYAAVPASTTIILIYRVYLPDATATITGNVPLPLITAHNVSDGTAVDCPTPAVNLPWTPLDPTTWGRFVRYGAGFLPNPDAAYLDAELPVTNTLYAVRFQAPTTPRTLDGSPITQTTQLRYWSVCLYAAKYMPYRAYEIRCVADEQAALDAHGVVTILTGPWWLKPSNATPANGVLWIPLTYGLNPVLIVVRHLLPDPGFTQSAFAVPYGAPAVPIMGAYAPTITACSTAQFQTNLCRS